MLAGKRVKGEKMLLDLEIDIGVVPMLALMTLIQIPGLLLWKTWPFSRDDPRSL